MTSKSTVSTASCLVSELTVSELTSQRVGLSASCLVSELVCQRVVLSASWLSASRFVSEMSVKPFLPPCRLAVPTPHLLLPFLGHQPSLHWKSHISADLDVSLVSVGDWLNFNMLKTSSWGNGVLTMGHSSYQIGPHRTKSEIPIIKISTILYSTHWRPCQKDKIWLDLVPVDTVKVNSRWFCWINKTK